MHAAASHAHRMTEPKGGDGGDGAEGEADGKLIFGSARRCGFVSAQGETDRHLLSQSVVDEIFRESLRSSTLPMQKNRFFKRIKCVCVCVWHFSERVEREPFWRAPPYFSLDKSLFL